MDAQHDEFIFYVIGNLRHDHLTSLLASGTLSRYEQDAVLRAYGSLHRYDSQRIQTRGDLIRLEATKRVVEAALAIAEEKSIKVASTPGNLNNELVIKLQRQKKLLELLTLYMMVDDENN